MAHGSFLSFACRRLMALVLGLLLVLAGAAQAQAPAWAAAVSGDPAQLNGTSQTLGTAVDAGGNVFVTGSFTGQVAFGSTVLTSLGSEDLFVAKWVPATATWAWAQSGGGTGADRGTGIAVNGTRVYVTGSLTNNTANANGVLFGGTGTVPGTAPQHGATATSSPDLLVAQYTDHGPSATLGWTQVGGGTGFDQGQGIAVSGTSVYVTGFLTNNTANSRGVLFGGTGPTAGTVAQHGASATPGFDLVVAKYTDHGPSATLDWTQVGGGTSTDRGQGIAVQGTRVYVTGVITNTTANSQGVVFGGTGTTAGTAPQYGASASPGNDVVVAQYTDHGPSATLGWTQVGGGVADDQGLGIAVAGARVYVTGFIINNTANSQGVVFGGTGPVPGTGPQHGATATASLDVVVAAYTDHATSATLDWTQVGGGTSDDQGLALAVNGTRVYVTGLLTNNAANSRGVLFGGSGTTAGTASQPGASATSSADVVVVAYTDNGPTATVGWTQVGGGPADDQGTGIAVSGTSVFVGGMVMSPTAAFGPAAGAPLRGTAGHRAVVGHLLDAATTGPWQTLAAATNGGTSQTLGTAVDASGNVFVTGVFTGQVAFGGTVLSSVGGDDLFVAKWVPATATWAWAQSGGGTGADRGAGLAVSGPVSGTRVYVTGSLTNNTANTSEVLFGGTGTVPGTVAQHGATATSSADLLVAAYTDHGTSATLTWTQVGGGTNTDQGLGIAVNGARVYVTGSLTNNTSNGNGVLFGGTGPTVGTIFQHGASPTSSADVVVANYTDHGPSATLDWTQVGGGTGTDRGQGIAVSGTRVYVTGLLTNTTANSQSVLFGGTGATAGTVPQHGASATSSNDVLVAAYTDHATSATLQWTQVGGGTGTDQGLGLAVHGPSVYVTGVLTNTTANANAVLFGGTGTVPGTVAQHGASATTSPDLVVTKYTDNGTSATVNWTQVGGGTGTDQGLGLAVSGTRVYVTGVLTNTTANANAVLFGGTGTTAGTVPQPGVTATSSRDLVVARYTDHGPSATLDWTQVGGGTGTDQGLALAVHGPSVYAVGSVVPVATFGSFTLSSPVGSSLHFLGQLVDTVPLPVELVRFTAEVQGSAARLHWATASEQANDRFEVEASVDGRTFSKQGTVAGHGSTSQPHAYSFVDADLARYAAPLVYYRLRQVDADGTFHYSPVRSVLVPGTGRAVGLVVYPTVALAAGPVRYAYTGPALAVGTRLELVDALGRRVWQQATTVAEAGALPVHGLRSGWYLLRLHTGTGLQEARFYQP